MNGPAKHAIAPLGVIGAVLILDVSAWMLLVGRRRYWSRHPELRAEQTVLVSDESLTVKVMHDDSTMEWTRWTYVQLTADVYVLQNKHRIHWILSRRAFASPADEQAFRRLVKRRLKANPEAAIPPGSRHGA